MENKRHGNRLLAGKHEGKGRLGRPRREWKNNTKWMSKKKSENVHVWPGFLWVRTRTSEGLLWKR
jgi:hypothetical protein